MPEEAMTAGWLRARLRELGVDTLDPALTDEDRLPSRPVMESVPNDPPSGEGILIVDPAADIDKIIREVTPDNPWLAEEWARKGILDLPPEFRVLDKGGEDAS